MSPGLLRIKAIIIVVVAITVRFAARLYRPFLSKISTAVKRITTIMQAVAVATGVVLTPVGINARGIIIKPVIRAIDTYMRVDAFC